MADVGAVRLAATGYLIAMYLIVAPFVDTYLLVPPADLSLLPWRYDTIGLVSLALTLPFLGLLLLNTVASLMDHRLMLRGASVLALLACLGLGVLAVAFLLDAQGFRQIVRPDLVRPVDRAWVVGTTKLGLGSLLMLAFCVGSWSASKPVRGR